MDPLEQVIEANSNYSQSPSHDTPGTYSNSRRNNVGSLFAQETPAQQINATANLLANAERLSPYRDIPNVFSEAAQQLELDSVRTNETTNTDNSNNGHNVYYQNSENRGGSPSYNNYNPFVQIPPQQRLFADTPGTGSAHHGNTVHHGGQSSSHILFNQSVPVHHGNSGEATRNAGGRHQGRQLQGASSAPASVDGGNTVITLSIRTDRLE